MSSLTHILLLIGVIMGCGVLLWRVTDQDPKKFRVNLARSEVERSKQMEKWAAIELASLAQCAGLKSAPSFGIANTGAHYSPIPNRICISRAYLCRLSKDDLRLILAHEIGHASRRWATFLHAGTLGEEISADRIALMLTGCTAKQWAIAMQASRNIEQHQGLDDQLSERAAALGIRLDW